jgi:branched-chain amino acid transport system substrate-binding protein
MPSATAPGLTKNRPFVFRVCFDDAAQARVAARQAYRRLHRRRAAVLIDILQDYSVRLARHFSREFRRLGGRVVARAFYQTGEQDFTSPLTAIVQARPDVLFLPDFLPDLAMAVRQARGQRIYGVLLAGDAGHAAELPASAPKTSHGMYLTAHYFPGHKKTRLVREFNKALGLKPPRQANSFHALAADALWLVVDALGRAGRPARPALRRALARTRNFKGLTGRISIGPSGNAGKEVVILVVNKGRFNRVGAIRVGR